MESDSSWLHTADVSKRSGRVGLHPSVARLFYRPYSFIPGLLGSARPFGGSAPVDPATAAFDMSIPAQAVHSQHVF